MARRRTYYRQNDYYVIGYDKKYRLVNRSFASERAARAFFSTIKHGSLIIYGRVILEK